MPVDPTPVTATPGNSIIGNVSNIFTSGTTSVLSGLFGQIPWIRIGEILLGLLMVNVGLAQLTGLGPSVTKAIAKAPI
jgi:hypothetical protein